MKPKYLNVGQVCKVLGVCRATFYRKHKRMMPYPTVFSDKRGLWWNAKLVQAYKRMMINP